MGKPKMLITGVREIDSLMEKLPARVGKKVLKKAVREALKPVLKSARKYAPRDSGELKKRTKIKTGKGGRYVVRLNVIGEAKDPKNDFFYPAVQNYGSESRGIPATRFMSRAYEEHKESSRAEMIKRIVEGLEREVETLKNGGS